MQQGLEEHQVEALPSSTAAISDEALRESGPQERRGWLRWALQGVGLVLLAVIATRIDLRRTIRIILHQNLLVLIGALALFVPQTFFRVWRWRIILRANACRLTIGQLCDTVLQGLFWGMVTPGRVGEFAKAGMLRKLGHSWGRALGATTLERLLDLGVILIVGILSAWVIQAVALSGTMKWGLIGVGALGAIAVGVSLFPRWKHLVLKLPFVRRYRERLGTEFDEFRDTLLSPRRRGAPGLAATTALLWLLAYLEVYLFARNLGIEVSFCYLIVTVSFGSVLTLLPISVSGVGTRDAAYILLLGSIGVDAERAVALAAMVLFMFVFNGCVCYIAVAWQNRRSHGGAVR
jgi:uncharacterized protein (TIRG00374 family)